MGVPLWIPLKTTVCVGFHIDVSWRFHSVAAVPVSFELFGSPASQLAVALQDSHPPRIKFINPRRSWEGPTCRGTPLGNSREPLGRGGEGDPQQFIP